VVHGRDDLGVADGASYQPHYSALAIATALTMRKVFHLGLRHTKGLIGSVIGPLGLDLAVPDHSTFSRRTRALDVPSRRRVGTGPLLWFAFYACFGWLVGGLHDLAHESAQSGLLLLVAQA
jgi:hypothetical protein